MLEINWKQDYKHEFTCPTCERSQLNLAGFKRGKRQFKCPKCQSHFLAYVKLDNRFRYSNTPGSIELFQWADDLWDLRTINPNFDARDSTYCTANFMQFELKWFKDNVKKYIQHLCKSENSPCTITLYLSKLRCFSRYLVKENISGFHEINRSIILDYYVQEQKLSDVKITALRNFFRVGTIKGWFDIDQDIIRDADYPKKSRGNPNPMSDKIREQIEQNLHLLPDPIARMWLIGYFSAMRPSELSFLKRNCLIQEGQYWKLGWHRKKTNDYHEIPISRTIAEVIQQQQEYIKNLWNDEWDYLFCHYHNLSSADLSQPNLEPVKKVLPAHDKNPLLVGIRSLITALDIRDENGKTAKFQFKLLRTTRLTELFAKGHDLSVVSAWAGHKRLVTTSTYYTEVSCELMDREAGHIQRALVNSNGHRVLYESFPKSFWEHPTAHKLDLSGTHINTPIYGYCGLPLDQDCRKFRACYTCQSFAATLEKLPQYINTHTELREKQAKAMSAGQEVLVEQFGKQAEQLDKIIASLQQEAA
jgi:integrase